MGLTPCRRANKQTTDFTSHLSPQKAHNQSTTPPANLSTSPIPPPLPRAISVWETCFFDPWSKNAGRHSHPFPTVGGGLFRPLVARGRPLADIRLISQSRLERKRLLCACRSGVCNHGRRGGRRGSGGCKAEDVAEEVGGFPARFPSLRRGSPQYRCETGQQLV